MTEYPRPNERVELRVADDGRIWLNIGTQCVYRRPRLTEDDPRAIVVVVVNERAVPPPPPPPPIPAGD